jgi:N-acetylglucosaminyldiphosphoundecaprenol N-acetyl-beta-D-mannosaminyltransferase
MQSAVGTIKRWIDTRDQQFVCVTGVHGVIESYRDGAIRKIHNSAGMVTPDGMPLVWFGHHLGFTQMARVYGPDLMLEVCEFSLRTGYRHFFYGGAPGVPEKLAAELQGRFPGLAVAGTYSPPFGDVSQEEDARIAQIINASRADIVWVGISTPKQEKWMASHTGRVDAPVLIGVGAAFDIHSGLKPQAPAWMRRSGLEWLFRLSTEPKRLWKRYAINNPLFVALAVRQLMFGWNPPQP